MDTKHRTTCICNPCGGVTIPSPVPAPRDWNNEAGVTVSTYKSVAQPGYALNVENVDSGAYRPYSRKGI